MSTKQPIIVCDCTCEQTQLEQEDCKVGGAPKDKEDPGKQPEEEAHFLDSVIIKQSIIATACFADSVKQSMVVTGVTCENTGGKRRLQGRR